MTYLFIDHLHNESFRIYADGITPVRYIGYSKRDAVQKFRRDNGLRYKHLNIIEWRS